MLFNKKCAVFFLILLTVVFSSLCMSYAYENHGTIKSSEVLIDGGNFISSGTTVSAKANGKMLELDKGAREGTYITQPIKSEMPFICYGVLWQPILENGTEIKIFARASKDGLSWGDWSELGFDSDIYSTRPEDEANSVLPSDPIFVDESNYAQVKAVMSSKDGKAKAALKKIRLAFIDGREGPTLNDIKKSMRATQSIDSIEAPNSASALSLLSAPSTLAVASTLTTYPRPTTITRTQWGCAQGESSPSWTPVYTTVTHLVVHHEAGSNNIPDPAVTMRSIWSYHTYTNGWGDIGYNYVISHDGTVFNGRANSNYFNNDTKGAHDANNTGSMGISCMGNYHPGISIPAIQPPQAMLEAVKELFAWKAAQRGIDPYGSAYYAGYGGTKPTIIAHRDVGSTACPGDFLYVKMQEIRDGVYSRLNSAPATGLTVDDDNGAPGYTTTGTWSTSASSGYNGGTYRFANSGSASTSVWTANLESAGLYKVSVIYKASTNRATSAKYNMAAASGTQTAYVNQTLNNLAWVTLGTYNFNAGSATVTLDAAGSSGGDVVIADAVQFELIPTPTNVKNNDNLAVTGTGIARIYTAAHAGSAAYMNDGVKTNQTLDSWNGTAKTSDYWGYTWTLPYNLNRVVYITGNSFSDGGWFSSGLKVQVRQNGTWIDAAGLTVTPVYPNNNTAVPYKTYTFNFTDTWGDGVRIIGVPGGTQHFTSLCELEAYYTDASVPPEPPAPVTIDNGGAGYTTTGTWSTSTSGGYNNGSYQYATAGTAKTATWAPNLPLAGTWKVSVIYKSGTNRATSAKFNVATAAGTQTVYVNQTQNNLVWVTLGTWGMSAGGGNVTLDAAGSSGGTSPQVIADAVKYEYVSP